MCVYIICIYNLYFSISFFFPFPCFSIHPKLSVLDKHFSIFSGRCAFSSLLSPSKSKIKSFSSHFCHHSCTPGSYGNTIGIPGHLFFFAVWAYLFCIIAVLQPHVQAWLSWSQQGLWIPRSSVRFRLKLGNSNSHGFQLIDPQSRVLNYCWK